MPLGLLGQKFGPECNVAILPQKLVGGIYRGLREIENYLGKKKKKPRVNFVQKRP